MRSFSLILFFSISTAAASNRTNSSWGGKSYDVVFTHCGSGSQCGGHQKCSNYELALSDAYLWNDLGISKPVGGVTTCPTSYFDSTKDCCNWATCPSYLRSQVPSCPLDSASSTAYPVCVTSKAGTSVTSYVTGCCPSSHPCNVCKAQYGYPGGCTDTQDQADLCDNLWLKLGSPPQTQTLTITIGECSSANDDGGSGGSDDGATCSDVPPDDNYTCEEQAAWGKCSSSWMKGYCCKSCFDCKNCS